MSKFTPVRLAYNMHAPVTGIDESLAPIIFLHGMTGSKEHWDDIPQVVANATKRRSYSLDARNHGDSDWSDEFNFDINVDDLLHFLDMRGIQRAILVGHSMGGITAIRTALRRPDKVEKIVVEDMFVRVLPKEILTTVHIYVKLLQQAIQEAPASYDEDGTKKFIMQFVHANAPPHLARMGEIKPEETEAASRHITLKRGAYGRCVYKGNLKTIEKALENPETLMSEPEGVVDVPACFIYGTLSPFLARMGEIKPEETEAASRHITLKRGAYGRCVYKGNLKTIEKALENPETLMSEPEGVVDVPACFIYGTLSPFLVGADQQHIKGFFPNAVFEGIEADHSVHPVKPLEFTDVLLKFIS